MSVLITALAIMAIKPNYFLDFSTEGTLSDVVKRFGNPMFIEDTKTEGMTKFTFERDRYLFYVVADKQSKINTLAVAGFNSFISYKNVHLGDTFSSVIKVRGNPDSYEFYKNEINLTFNDSVYLVTKLSKKWTVAGITVFTNGKNAVN